MILIRCDSSTVIGTGHVFRCLALAHQLRQEGHEIQFICQDLPGHIAAQIQQEAYAVHLLGPQEDDIAKIRSLAKPEDWLIIDHYQIDRQWEKALKDHVKIFVIDDLHNRVHDCQVILDQNFHRGENPYENLIPGHCIRLLGPRYCLLRDEFKQARKQLPAFKNREPSVLAFFGGGDPTKETLRFIQALQKSKTSVRFEILISKSNPSLEEIKNLGLPANIRLHVSPEKVSALMQRCSLYFGSGGTVTWERMFLGLPGLVVSVADNQTEIAKDLMVGGQQVFLGMAAGVNYEKSVSEIEKYLDNKEWLQSTSQKNLSLVRALSPEILSLIFHRPQQGFSMRLVRGEDARFLYDLRNDPEARKMFLNQDEVSWEDHQNWFEKTFSSESFRIYIGYLDSQPKAQFRVRADGDTSITVSSEARGKGLASQLIQAASEAYMREFQTVEALYARVKPENLGSQRSFEKAGYRFHQKTKLQGKEYSELIFQRKALS